MPYDKLEAEILRAANACRRSRARMLEGATGKLYKVCISHIRDIHVSEGRNKGLRGVKKEEGPQMEAA